VKVAIGAVAGPRGGPATYAIELVRALAELFPRDEWTVLTDRPDYFPDAETVKIPLGSPWAQPLWDHLHVGRALTRRPFDLYHGTKGVLPRVLRAPGVVTVHDLSVRAMPQTFSRAQRLHLRIETPSTLRRARVVVTDSRASANDLRRWYPRTRDKIEVIPLAAGRALAPATTAEIAAWKSARGIDGTALVGYLGTLQPRKNIDVLARAFLEAAGERRWQLVIAGRIRPGYAPECLRAPDSRIRYLGEIPDDELAPFLGALSCMVSPSSYEGFGLTFLEAMAAGCPVVGVATSSVPEVVGDAGILVREPNVHALADAIETLVLDIGLAADHSRRGVERAALLSWKETARKTRAAYERALAG
jgi:glycosyltransferase involved in cell wall biosynthesis